MNHAKFVGRQNYQRTLLAVYFLADDEGLVCEATYAQLSAQTGLYVDTVRGHLRELERNAVIRIVQGTRRPRRRFIVLLDHPYAEGFIDGLNWRSWTPQPTWMDGPR